MNPEPRDAYEPEITQAGNEFDDVGFHVRSFRRRVCDVYARGSMEKLVFSVLLNCNKPL
jgi:hypothetical protein